MIIDVVHSIHIKSIARNRMDIVALGIVSSRLDVLTIFRITVCTYSKNTFGMSIEGLSSLRGWSLHFLHNFEPRCCLVLVRNPPGLSALP